jgi:hypothetical protein
MFIRGGGGERENDEHDLILFFPLQYKMPFLIGPLSSSMLRDGAALHFKLLFFPRAETIQVLRTYNTRVWVAQKCFHICQSNACLRAATIV